VRRNSSVGSGEEKALDLLQDKSLSCMFYLSIISIVNYKTARELIPHRHLRPVPIGNERRK